MPVVDGVQPTPWAVSLVTTTPNAVDTGRIPPDWVSYPVRARTLSCNHATPKQFGICPDCVPAETPDANTAPKEACPLEGPQSWVPFWIYYGERCPAAAGQATVDSINRNTGLVLDLDTPFQLAAELLTGAQTGNASLTDGQAIYGHSADPVTALGDLVEWWELNGGVGSPILHAPSKVARRLVAEQVVARDGNRLVDTTQGIPLIPGPGYRNIGPGGLPAPPGTGWLYVSGPVDWAVDGAPLAGLPGITEGDLTTDLPAGGLVWQSNEFEQIRERLGLVRLESCNVFAVLVSLGCGCCDPTDVPAGTPIAGAP